MARSYRYLHYDVFTDRRFGGNQLAVVADARGLSTEMMQAIANEMHFSETTFVLPAERADTDARMRIFTPGAEMPLAGHPTIGTTFALVRTGAIEPPRVQWTFGLGVGPVPVSLVWRGEDLGFAWMTQLNPTFDPPIDNAQGAAAMLGVRARAVAESGLPVQVVSCGLSCLLVPMATRRDVDAAVADGPAWSAFMAAIESPPPCVFFFSVEPGEDGATAYSRMFAPALGIGEDPATGGASGPLGSYLVRHGVVDAAKAAAMVSVQGVKMGRPSRVHISIAANDGAITSVRVGGEAVFVGEGFLQI